MIKTSVFVAAVVMAALPATMAQAQSGTFRTAHDLGWGGAENADPIHPNRFWQVTEKTMNRLVRPGASGEPSPDLAVSWSANDSATEWIGSAFSAPPHLRQRLTAKNLLRGTGIMCSQ